MKRPQETGLFVNISHRSHKKRKERKRRKQKLTFLSFLLHAWNNQWVVNGNSGLVYCRFNTV